MNKILVTGGAGYIGSHMVANLIDAGYGVVIYDNLSSGFRDSIIGGEFIKGDLADQRLLDDVFNKHQIEAVMHFAGSISVSESMNFPKKYYENNVQNTIKLLDTMLRHDVKKIIFSSSAAIFGEPLTFYLNTNHPKKPINPYGWSKLIIEKILENYQRFFGLEFIALRYFNAAGAHPLLPIGERHNPETHLIPLVLQVASNERPYVTIFGTDYPTQDGTCVRDYIHILDLCQAHLLGLKYLADKKTSGCFNLGNGTGFSINQIIKAAEIVTGKLIATKVGERRAGDPAVLVADASLAKNILGWQPQFSDIETIISHAWNWEQLRNKSPIRSL